MTRICKTGVGKKLHGVWKYKIAFVFWFRSVGWKRQNVPQPSREFFIRQKLSVSLKDGVRSEVHFIFADSRFVLCLINCSKNGSGGILTEKLKPLTGSDFLLWHIYLSLCCSTSPGLMTVLKVSQFDLRWSLARWLWSSWLLNMT